MNKVDIQVTLHIDPDALFNTLLSVLMHYEPTSRWADLQTGLMEPILVVKELDLANGEPGRVPYNAFHVLTPPKTVAALAALIAHGVHEFSEMRYNALLVACADMNALDDDMADALVQMACFNEIRYG